MVEVKKMFKGILSPVITVLDEHGKIDFQGNEK